MLPWHQARPWQQTVLLGNASLHLFFQPRPALATAAPSCRPAVRAHPPVAVPSPLPLLQSHGVRPREQHQAGPQPVRPDLRDARASHRIPRACASSALTTIIPPRSRPPPRSCQAASRGLGPLLRPRPAAREPPRGDEQRLQPHPPLHRRQPRLLQRRVRSARVTSSHRLHRSTPHTRRAPPTLTGGAR